MMDAMGVEFVQRTDFLPGREMSIHFLPLRRLPGRQQAVKILPKSRNLTVWNDKM